MASRFVAAGTEPDPSAASDDWARAKQDVETTRLAGQATKSKQDDGQSLYEVLQANKAAKQEAFEEAARLRNQFRTLDDSEVAFLESVQEKEWNKELLTKRETAEQLDSFRKQRAAAEQAALKAAQLQNVQPENRSTPKPESWTSSKKRRRVDNSDDVSLPIKQRKSSEIMVTGDKTTIDQSASKAAPQATITKQAQPTTATDQVTMKPSAKPVTAGTAVLGLGAYGSDDD